ncbi:hypothetical protein BROUX41_005864 [Berkeleyomyces rouxiae]|uniref:uncharacterized protein n=1 Tax=Berkeleyomyces rouxiae TaxID=2035830 RepID=UPI003B7E16E6
MRLPVPAILKRDALTSTASHASTASSPYAPARATGANTMNMNSFDLRAESESDLSINDENAEVVSSIVPTTVDELSGLPTQITEIESTATENSGGLAFAGALTTETTLTTSTTASATLEQTSAATTTEVVLETGSDSGMSSAGVAGVVIGLLGFVLVAGLAGYFFLMQKKKQAQRKRLMDEKPDFLTSMNPNGSAPIRPAPPTGPGSSLRNPSTSGPSVPLKDVAGSTKSVSSTSPDSASVRESQTETIEANPFGANAEKINAPESQNPFSDEDSILPDFPLPESKENPAATETVPATTTTTAAAPAAEPTAAPLMKRQASRRHDHTKLDLAVPTEKSLPGPPSPTASEYSVSSSPEVAACAEPENPGAWVEDGVRMTAPVHRVKIEFTPSMKDEMALQTGQLVRMLHLYDDGWALCSRLDRSQQGVVPCTCLSEQPIKPRASTSKPPVSMDKFVRPESPEGRSSSPGRAY